MNKTYNLANKLIEAQINGKVISPYEYNFLKTTEEAYRFQDITEKILKMTLLHDLAESRIGDYTPDEIDGDEKKRIENKAFFEITEN